MTPIEHAWLALETMAEFGGARRLGAESRHDFYALLDAEGRRGLLLISTARPPNPPAFDAVHISIGERSDSRWSLTIRLNVPGLSSVFAELCQSIANSSEGIANADVPSFVVSRLIKWRELLDAASAGTLGLQALRGLVGELIVMRECLRIVDPPAVVDGWLGPSGAPQDFALPGALLEAKAIRPTAVSIPISSVAQLDVAPGVRLFLAVVTLASLQGEAVDTFSAASLVLDLRSRLKAFPVASAEFDARLRRVGYDDLPAYDASQFRIDAIRYYQILPDFPMIRRSQLPDGILEARYDLSYAACGPFEVSLEDGLLGH
jgi:hypothetical protein